ncbi:hypothetical protein CYMTET_15466 [Cymbomonas tetramitiformis]|uniref:Protein kinase domain-containing protein n=1 Tax=Cymbomonas tetramitiformis TaxID=36881 RepID=A0AAE0GEB3_9CHLO|nr:hypothetical protein CYMTET_15466 [Cymbomonas tetramitiformis]
MSSDTDAPQNKTKEHRRQSIMQDAMDKGFVYKSGGITGGLRKRWYFVKSDFIWSAKTAEEAQAGAGKKVFAKGNIVDVKPTGHLTRKQKVFFGLAINWKIDASQTGTLELLVPTKEACTRWADFFLQAQRDVRIEDTCDFMHPTQDLNFSCTVLGTRKATATAPKRPCDIKVISVEGIKNLGLNDQVESEIAVLRMLGDAQPSNPYVRQLHLVMDTEKYKYLVFDHFAGANLMEHIRSISTTYSEIDAKKIIRQVLRALSMMHAEGVVFSGVTAENILVSDAAIIKLLSCEHATFTWRRAAQRGIVEYMAPEMLANHSRDADVLQKSDLWACGVLAFLLLTGRHPFVAHDYGSLAALIKSGKWTLPSDLPVSKDARELLETLLNLDPAKRLSANDALELPWFALQAQMMTTPPVLISAVQATCKCRALQTFRRLVRRAAMVIMWKYALQHGQKGCSMLCYRNSVFGTGALQTFSAATIAQPAYGPCQAQSPTEAQLPFELSGLLSSTPTKPAANHPQAAASSDAAPVAPKVADWGFEATGSSEEKPSEDVVHDDVIEPFRVDDDSEDEEDEPELDDDQIAAMLMAKDLKAVVAPVAVLDSHSLGETPMANSSPSNGVEMTPADTSTPVKSTELPETETSASSEVISTAAISEPGAGHWWERAEVPRNKAGLLVDAWELEGGGDDETAQKDAWEASDDEFLDAEQGMEEDVAVQYYDCWELDFDGTSMTDFEDVIAGPDPLSPRATREAYCAETDIPKKHKRGSIKRIRQSIKKAFGPKPPKSLDEPSQLSAHPLPMSPASTPAPASLAAHAPGSEAPAQAAQASARVKVDPPQAASVVTVEPVPAAAGMSASPLTAADKRAEAAPPPSEPMTSTSTHASAMTPIQPTPAVVSSLAEIPAAGAQLEYPAPPAHEITASTSTSAATPISEPMQPSTTSEDRDASGAAATVVAAGAAAGSLAVFPTSDDHVSSMVGGSATAVPEGEDPALWNVVTYNNDMVHEDSDDEDATDANGEDTAGPIEAISTDSPKIKTATEVHLSQKGFDFVSKNSDLAHGEAVSDRGLILRMDEPGVKADIGYDSDDDAVIGLEKGYQVTLGTAALSNRISEESNTTVAVMASNDDVSSIQQIDMTPDWAKGTA